MLILLPPSEGKSSPRRGRPLDLATLDLPELTEARAAMLEALVSLCAPAPGEPVTDEAERVEEAARVLGLGPTQHDEVRRNAALLTAPTTRADRIYTGVLYDALDLVSLDAAARRRATRWLAIASSLFGLVRLNDAIPAYRLSGDVTLPGLGSVAAHWRTHLGPAAEAAAGSGLIVDLRSTAYTAFWRPAPPLTARVATMRVLHESGGKRTVVSHFNKATKGRIVRDLLRDGSAPTTPERLAEHLGRLGWTVEVRDPDRSGQQLDVVVGEL